MYNVAEKDKGRRKENLGSVEEAKMRRGLEAKLARYVADVLSIMDGIPAERRGALENIAHYVSEHVNTGRTAKLVFICLHNSRRSLMSQIWAQTAAAYYGIGAFEAYSGGTEATAFNPRAVSAMRRAGFQIEKLTGTDNPEYRVTYAAGKQTLKVFSKKYGDRLNPQAGFGAVMTCSEADEACPVVTGADFRQAIPYDDPQKADDTPEEEPRYDERCFQIATEMYYIFSTCEVEVK